MGDMSILRPPILLAALSIIAVILIFATTFHFSVSDVNSWTRGALHAPLRSLACVRTSAKPNLIVSAADGASKLEDIFMFMESLDAALGQELLVAQRENTYSVAEVHVKVLTPPEFAEDLPDTFKALLERYKNLEIIGSLPVNITDWVMLNRFIGWSRLLGEVESSYDKVLVADLDIVFQRNPFSMPLNDDVGLLLFAEWSGFKIGQCKWHDSWFQGCSNTTQGAFITEEQHASYGHLDRICAGSTYGTAHAIAAYLDLMTSELARSNYECNDQAIHIHLFYSGKMQETLRAQSVGDVQLVPNAESLFGTVGTNPFVRYNEWGEMVNDLDQVQVAVHQFKHHRLLADMARRKYGWQTKLGGPSHTPPLLEVNKTFTEAKPAELAQFLLVGVGNGTCENSTTLCSCRWDDCQFHMYEEKTYP